MKSKKTLSIRSLTVFDVLCLFVLFTFTEEFIKWLMFKFVWIPTVPSMQSPPSKTSQVKVVDGLQNTSRGQYGGGSDAIHLGGWTKQPDFGGLSNNTFNFLLGIIGIKSFLDVGCGRGISTSYFLNKGADVLCVEGSHEAISQSLLPPNKIVEHDYSLGPWWPSKTYDACWSVEFVEHVPRHYIRNYMSTFQQCALLFVSRSQWGGWSHVEIHQEWWWISRFRVHSFVFDRELTEIIRSHAEADKRASDKTLSKENQVKNQLGQHIRATMMVFVNPKVNFLTAMYVFSDQLL